ncbi:hypothetical protein LTR84_008843 [Exophiala bonariae]|uniref:Transcription factor domain-containing protein n=1 Tax=Exophiala bonariae TaxID=1690606 RepID=A0AAV9MYY9_9EURO|nr:hypothetical protein LTR84_008843 [Exophiala bonariae]
MAKSTGKAATRGTRVISTGKTASHEGKLVFVPIESQPSTSLPLSPSIRPTSQKHAALERLPDMPLSNWAKPFTSVQRNDIGQRLSRFRLERSDRYARKRRPLVSSKYPDICTHVLSISHDAVVESSDHSTGASEPNSASTLPLERHSQPHISLLDATSTYRRDHFTVFPVEDNDLVQSLFAFCWYSKVKGSQPMLMNTDLNDLNNKNLAKNPNRDFIPIALSSAACFHVLMATVLQVQRAQGRPADNCFWYHRGGAIASLNKDLLGAESLITDAMFCAVGMLAYVEV